MDHPGVLANLAWARLSNPMHPPGRRSDDARELLLLAEQFDPHHGEGQYYLGELLYRLGEYAAAMPRAHRAVNASPPHPGAPALYKKLKARKQA
jgi:tetratricopeptide (TPR) repeat protein